ncbi:MAG: transposase [Bacteroidota bacterium]|nr:transposase [Bacteroidota bacterium]
MRQYTHRVAITNQRILNIIDTHVTFIAKDYRDRAQKIPEKPVPNASTAHIPIYYCEWLRYVLTNDQFLCVCYRSVDNVVADV